MAIKDLKVSSISFEHNASIPKQFTCDGENINPHLRIDEIPESADCLAIIVDDPDAPNGTFTHWMAWNIPPRAKIMENSFPEEGTQGQNDFGKRHYMGPCPPSGEEHRYFFKVYALDSKVDLDPANADKAALEIMLEEKKIGYGELIGLYRKA